MRKISLILGVLIYASTVHAQKDLPSFGKIDKSEFASLQCSYDPDAEAEVLVNYASMQYQVNGGIVSTEVEYRVRIKILKEKAVDRANIVIPYLRGGNGSKISKIDGITYNADPSGNVLSSKLEKSAIYDKDVDKRWSQIAFSMPGVKVGSIFEYRFVQFTRGFNINSWFFQDEIPTRISSYNVQLPTILKFQEKYTSYLPIEKRNNETGSDLYKSYVMRNVPGVRKEPYTSSINDYMQKMDFSLIAIEIPGQLTETFRNNWTTVGDELLSDEDFGLQLKKNLELPEKLASQLKTAKNDYQKMVFIYDLVRNSMNWNDKHSIWAFDGIKKSWQSKSGNSGEINLILINLLKDAKLDAYPIMVSTREHGRVNVFHPSSQHFNSVMAFVQIDTTVYILDGTNKFNPVTLVPKNVANTDGLLLVSKQEANWVTMDPNKELYRLSVLVVADVSVDGKISGEANINSYGYSRTNRLELLNKGKQEFADRYFTNVVPDISIEDVNVKNQDNDSLPLEQLVKFNLPTTKSGEYHYFTPNLFLGLQNNEFISEKRSTDIDFGYNQMYSLVGSFKLPDDYIVEELPKNKRLILPDKSITLLRMMEFVDHKVNIRIVLDFKQPVYGLDGYADFQAFYKMLFDTLNEQIVIKKKA